jgi:hypothetical protein
MLGLQKNPFNTSDDCADADDAVFGKGAFDGGRRETRR